MFSPCNDSQAMNHRLSQYRTATKGPGRNIFRLTYNSYNFGCDNENKEADSIVIPLNCKSKCAEKQYCSSHLIEFDSFLELPESLRLEVSGTMWRGSVLISQPKFMHIDSAYV